MTEQKVNADTTPQQEFPSQPQTIYARDHPYQPQAVYHHPDPSAQPQFANGMQQQMMVQPCPLTNLGQLPSLIDCPFCQQRTQTRIAQDNSSMTVLAGIGLGCICICAACLPCMLHWCQDTDHFCTRCNQRVAHVPYNGVPQPILPANNVPQGYVMGQQPHQQYGGVQNPAPVAVAAQHEGVWTPQGQPQGSLPAYEKQGAV